MRRAVLAAFPAARLVPEIGLAATSVSSMSTVDTITGANRMNSKRAPARKRPSF